MTALLVQSLDARWAREWRYLGRVPLNVSSPIEPTVWGEVWAYSDRWVEDPPPCETCLSNWANEGSDGLGGGGGTIPNPCKEESLGYTYVVTVTYRLTSTPTSPNHTKQLSFGMGGFKPNSSKSIWLPVPQTGTYDISVIVTSEKCEDCCTPPSTDKVDAHVQYSLEFDRDLLRNSSGKAFLPIDIEQERVIPACIRTDEC